MKLRIGSKNLSKKLSQNLGVLVTLLPSLSAVADEGSACLDQARNHLEAAFKVDLKQASMTTIFSDEKPQITIQLNNCIYNVTFEDQSCLVPETSDITCI